MKIFGYSVEECLTFFMLVVVGYFIAKLFSQKCNGFSVGAQTTCDGISHSKCEKLHPRRCKWDYDKNKCTDINAPAPTVNCKKDGDCKSGICYEQKCSKCENLNKKECKHNNKCKLKGKKNKHCVPKK